MKLWVHFINTKSIVVTLTMLGLASTLIWYNTKPKINLVETNSFGSSPDYFLTDVIKKEFDSNGKLIEILQAKQTLHYIKASRTEIDKPVFEKRSALGSWNALAEKGVIEDGSKNILLTNNAKAVKKHSKSENIILKANSMHYLDSTKSLTSTGSAQLISTQGTTSANTIITYVNSEKVIMTGSVRGNYETIN